MKPIADFPDYFVTEDGQVWSKNTQNFLRPCSNSHGYLIISLHLNGKRHHKQVHRLVLETFLTNPENKPLGNHLDGNKQNNHLNNLKWATYTENALHAYATGLRTPTYIGGPQKHAVEQWKDDILVTTFPSIRAASKAGFWASAINKTVHGKQKHHHGYQWKYANA